MVKRNIPTVVLITEAFLAEAHMITKANGVPSLPIIVLPHNVEFLSRREIEAITDKVCEEAVKLLTQPAKEAISRIQ